jgi:hypothetical protein
MTISSKLTSGPPNFQLAYFAKPHMESQKHSAQGRVMQQWKFAHRAKIKGRFFLVVITASEASICNWRGR